GVRRLTAFEYGQSLESITVVSVPITALGARKRTWGVLASLVIWSDVSSLATVRFRLRCAMDVWGKQWGVPGEKPSPVGGFLLLDRHNVFLCPGMPCRHI